jgi:hypothetical protein
MAPGLTTPVQAIGVVNPALAQDPTTVVVLALRGPKGMGPGAMPDRPV